TTTSPPSSCAATRASSGLVASRPSETGMPTRMKSSLPWYSYRSKPRASLADESREARILPDRLEVRVGGRGRAEPCGELERAREMRQRLLGLAGERFEAGEVVEEHRVVAVPGEGLAEDGDALAVAAGRVVPARPPERVPDEVDPQQPPQLCDRLR